jgi:hypothetical protein
MSAHETNPAAPTWKKGLTALTVSAAAVWLALAATPAAADQPEPTTRPETTATMPTQGPPNYPNYDPRYEVPRVVHQGGGLEATSVALGALGGIALAGAGLGITLGIQRRRDHAALHTA